MLPCKTGSQLAPCLCVYTYADMLFIHMCSEPAPMHCSTAQGKLSSPVFSAALQNSLTACTLSLCLHLSSSYRCAVSEHQCTAALLRATSAPQCSLLPCKTGSQFALCHCVYTYADLLFIQVCNEPASMHCSTAQGRISSPVFSAALQNRLTACTL